MAKLLWNGWISNKRKHRLDVASNHSYIDRLFTRFYSYHFRFCLIQARKILYWSYDENHLFLLLIYTQTRQIDIYVYHSVENLNIVSNERRTIEIRLCQYRRPFFPRLSSNMETALGCGYSINEESALTDFYSPPTSIIDEEEEEELFYPEEEEEIPSTFQSISLRDQLKPLPLKLMSIGTTTTPPTTPRNCLDPLQSTIMDFQKMKILPDLSSSSSDRHSLFEPCGMSHASSDLHVERSRLYSYLNPMEDSMMMKSSNYSRPVQSFFPVANNQDSWFLSDLVRQNHPQISLSTTAQQILNGNNRPLRSEKIDIEVIKHLIREANWKRQCGMKKEVRHISFGVHFFDYFFY